MRPSRLILRFLAKICLVFILEIIVLNQVKAQCSGSLTAITYDSVVTGTGNDVRTYSFPKFKPATGTLVAVVLKSVVSLKHSYAVENQDNVAEDYTIGVGRVDFISSSALLGPVWNVYQQDYGTYNLGAEDATPLSGPDYIANGPYTDLSGSTVINDSIITNVANFMGTSGKINFSYTPTSYLTIDGGTDYYSDAAYNDTVNFSLTYYYCSTSVLAADITGFTAAKETNTTVKLAWTTENEEAGRTYEIQESGDGHSFMTAASMPAEPGNNSEGNYTYHYAVRPDDGRTLYFRLKETDQSGTVKYSAIRIVNLDEDGASIPSVFPNPATSFINVAFNQPVAKNWQVDIYDANGVLVLQKVCLHTQSARLEFKGKPAAGVYFMRVTDLQTRKSYVETFVVE